MPEDRDSMTPALFKTYERIDNYGSGNAHAVGNLTGYQDAFVSVQLLEYVDGIASSSERRITC